MTPSSPTTFSVSSSSQTLDESSPLSVTTLDLPSIPTLADLGEDPLIPQLDSDTSPAEERVETEDMLEDFILDDDEEELEFGDDWDFYESDLDIDDDEEFWKK